MYRTDFLGYEELDDSLRESFDVAVFKWEVQDTTRPQEIFISQGNASFTIMFDYEYYDY